METPGDKLKTAMKTLTVYARHLGWELAQDRRGPLGLAWTLQKTQRGGRARVLETSRIQDPETKTRPLRIGGTAASRETR